MLDIIVEKDDQNSTQVLRLIGEIDHSEKERIRGSLSKITDEPSRGLVVDITEISYMDSSGIGLLIALSLMLKETGTNMAVVINNENHLTQKFKHLGMFTGPGISAFESLEEAKLAVLSH